MQARHAVAGERALPLLPDAARGRRDAGRARAGIAWHAGRAADRQCAGVGNHRTGRDQAEVGGTGDCSRSLARKRSVHEDQRRRRADRMRLRQGPVRPGEAHRQGNDRYGAQYAGRYRSLSEDGLGDTRLFDLTGKAALVTGASGGIGGAIARMLHKQGATVTLSGTRSDVLEQLKGTMGERTHVVTAKMDDAADIDRLAKEAEAAMGGKLDILVNNAGITRDNISMRMKDEEWEKVLLVNLTGTFRLIRATMRGMMKRRFGRVINITSIVGVTGNPGQANYAAAKAGLIGMSKSLAQELASRSITVNCIAPGFIATPMTDVLTDEQKKGILGRVPADRLGTPEEIAASVVYLASDEAAYVTGQTLHINGGMAMI